MAEIVLSTLNARYAHASLALRSLRANLGDMSERAEIIEFTIAERAVDIAETILSRSPTIVGLGVYIWNAVLTAELVAILKAVRPQVIVVIGGPEVSHEILEQPICRAADYTIAGEGEVALRELCAAILAGERPRAPVIRAAPLEFAALVSPYHLYTDDDLRDRHVYVEASRGCPFKCEFCLSSLDKSVRSAALEPFLADLDRLIERGARHIKFIDRTFNLSIRTSSAILEFFLERVSRGVFAHFEMVPDRLPEPLRELIVRFPPGALQFEIGIQTFDSATAARISRVQDLERLEDNLRFLASKTSVHVHADLIAGLPGENVESFARGFNRLVALGPHEIQVGILKRLRGTPIIRHTVDFEMIYADRPPYEVLSTSEVSFEELSGLKRFARLWDLVANRGNFRESLPTIWGEDPPFDGFNRFSGWLSSRVGHFSGIALERLTRLLFEYLSSDRGLDRCEVGAALARDFTRPGRRVPAFLSEYASEQRTESVVRVGTPKRQARFLA